MKTRLGIAVVVTAISLLSYFRFPGHTYLHQDTQIYLPILENLNDPGVLSRDLLVERPHVAFTLYDELTVGIRRITGLPFPPILAAIQILTRALGCWGIYLIAIRLLEDSAQALFVTALFSLGAAVDGPAVLVTEYEPSPRAFAIPLLFLAIGLAVSLSPVWASVTAAAAFVLHPPSVLSFWVVFFIAERTWRVWIPFLAACVLLFWAAAAQPGIQESQVFFSRLTPELERLQRMRASYNWVSLWWSAQAGKYLFLTALIAAGYWRVRQLGIVKLGIFLIALPLLGLLSVPVSYLLLEREHWALMPQIQPARTLLFVAALAILLSGVCGCLAARKRQWPEAVLWFVAAYLPPLLWGHYWLCLFLACAAALAFLPSPSSRRWSLALAGAAGFFLIPLVGGIRNYPVLNTPALQALGEWARTATPRSAIFAFPDFGKRLEPGIFRSESLRAVYVDWKGGGQVNYLPELGSLWWSRWQDVMLTPINPGHYSELGIDYFVVVPQHRIPGRAVAFENAAYVVYAATPGGG